MEENRTFLEVRNNLSFLNLESCPMFGMVVFRFQDNDIKICQGIQSFAIFNSPNLYEVFSYC